MRSFTLLRVCSVRAVLGAALALWLGAFCLCQSGAAADPPPPHPQVAEAIAQLEKWDQFFTSMRIEFLVRRETSDGPVEDQVEWIVGDLGATRLQIVTRTPAGAMRGRQIFLTLDGRTIMLSYPHGESHFDQPRAATISAGRADGSPMLAGPLFRLQDPLGRSLLEWIRQRDIQVKSPVTEDGVEYYEWAVLSRSGFPPRRLLLAPHHGCQLRVLESLQGRNQVLDCREVAPGIWFPWKGEFESGMGGPIARWEVQKLEFNEPVSDEAFIPPYQLGMPINDRIEMRKYRHGIPEPEEDYEASSSINRALMEVYRGRFLFILLATIPILVVVMRGLKSRSGEGPFVKDGPRSL